MTAVLILGGSGMLGHKLYQVCDQKFITHATVRHPVTEYTETGLFDQSRIFGGVTAEDIDGIGKVITAMRPTVVVNCIGVVKQHADAQDPIAAISINSLFPHRIARVCRLAKARFIHISTDCVFSGRAGNYREDDVADAEDLYGRTKYLGEVSGPNCLTLRTSMIGRELKGCHGLVEWLYSQRGGRVRGFKRAIFSGFTTQALSQIIARIIEKHPALEGIYNVAADPISKFDLLNMISHKAKLNIEIQPDETFVCDRSLNGGRFRAVTGFTPPPWSDMVTGLVNDPTPYQDIRRSLIAN